MLLLLDGIPAFLYFNDGNPNEFVRIPLLRHKSVTPLGWSGGEGIDTTVMENVTLRTYEGQTIFKGPRTFQPRKLRAASEVQVVGLYDADVWNHLANVLNINMQFAVEFSDAKDVGGQARGTRIKFWGYLAKAEFGELREGSAGEVTLTIRPTLCRVMENGVLQEEQPQIETVQ